MTATTRSNDEGTTTVVRAVAATAVAALLTAVLVTPPAEAAPVGSAANVAAKGCASGVSWLGKCANAGYTLARGCGQAWCGTVGALGHRQLYRTDPAARHLGGHKKKTRWKAKSGKPRGSQCTWGKARGHKAAYVASRWGRTTSNVDAAAVDIAIIHFLCGKQKRWRINGNATRHRLTKASGLKTTKVRKRARKMKRTAKKQHGPYSVAVRAPARNGLGEATTVTATVTTAKGRAARGRKAVLHLPGGGTRTGTTNGDGEVIWTIRTNDAGEQDYEVAVRVEQHRLAVKKPKHRAGTRLVKAGKHRTIREDFTMSVKNQPTGAGFGVGATLPAQLTGSFTYSGSVGTAPKTVIRRLRGGPGVANPTCDSKVWGTWNDIRSGDFVLPTFSHSTFTHAGKYVWEVVVSGDGLNHPVRWCSNTIDLAKATPTVEVEPMGAPLVDVIWTGYVAPPNGDIVVTMYGPFSTPGDAECAGPVHDSQPVPSHAVDGSGGRHPVELQRSSTGPVSYYTVEATLIENRANRTATVCSGPFQSR